MFEKLVVQSGCIVFICLFVGLGFIIYFDLKVLLQLVGIMQMAFCIESQEGKLFFFVGVFGVSFSLLLFEYNVVIGWGYNFCVVNMDEFKLFGFFDNVEFVFLWSDIVVDYRDQQLFFLGSYFLEFFLVYLEVIVGVGLYFIVVWFKDFLFVLVNEFQVLIVFYNQIVGRKRVIIVMLVWGDYLVVVKVKDFIVFFVIQFDIFFINFVVVFKFIGDFFDIVKVYCFLVIVFFEKEQVILVYLNIFCLVGNDLLFGIGEQVQLLVFVGQEKRVVKRFDFIVFRRSKVVFKLIGKFLFIVFLESKKVGVYDVDLFVVFFQDDFVKKVDCYL